MYFLKMLLTAVKIQAFQHAQLVASRIDPALPELMGPEATVTKQKL